MIDANAAARGQRISEARLEAGLTQTQLAQAISTSERNISRWETGRNSPRLPHLLAIAQATGKEVGWFLETAPFPSKAA